MLDIPNYTGSDVKNNLSSDNLGRSQSVRKNSQLPPLEADLTGVNLGRSNSVRLPNRTNSVLMSRNSQRTPKTEGSLKKMSKFLHESLLGGEQVKQEFVKLYGLQEATFNEFKKLKQHLETLAKDHETLHHTSNWLTKYKMLKAMIKRCAMHLKIGDDCQTFSPIVAKEINRKIEEKYSELNSETLVEEKITMRKQIEINQNKIETLKEVFTDLDTQYEASKKYSALTRYQMLNALVKDLLSRPNVQDLL